MLRLRSQVERAARRELAVQMAEVHGVEQRLAAAEQGLIDCANQAVRTDSVGQLARALEQGLRRHRWRLQQERTKAEQRLEQVRTDYTHKARELRTLQRLHDQQKDEWRLRVQRAEQAELDELATLTRGAAALADNAEDTTW